jgi:hypothetical protein
LAETKKEKAPGQRCLADQTPLSVWGLRAPIQIPWIAVDPAKAESGFRCISVGGVISALQYIVVSKG